MSESMLNGTVRVQNGHKSSDLEDSVLSLLSNSGALDQTDNGKTVLSKGYKKAAKLFINKMFDQSLHSIEPLIIKSVELYDHEEIDEGLYLNVWSLYFNLIDILINKGVKQLKREEHEDLEDNLVAANGIFTVIYNSDKIAPPKVLVLLLLIKLNNEQVDLKALRQQIDMYLVQGSSYFHGNPDFLELLEIYHVHLLAKMGEFEEAEYLIKTNPSLVNKQEILDKLAKEKIALEEAKTAKIEAQKKRQLAQLKKEQVAQQRLKEKKSVEKIQRNSSRNETTKEVQDVSLDILEQIKKRVFSLSSSSNKLIVVLSLLSFIFYLKRLNFFRLNENLRRRLGQVWMKVVSTAQMAFQVTYV